MKFDSGLAHISTGTLGIEQLNGETLYKKVNNKKRYYGNINKGKIDGNYKRSIEHLDGENLFSTNDKRLIDIIINKMKNEGNGNALYQLMEGQNIDIKHFGIYYDRRLLLLILGTPSTANIARRYCW